MYSQVFKIYPDLTILERVYNCFDIDTIKHDLIINISDINDKDIIKNFINIKPILEKKYRKNKIDKLYENLNLKKCITILRQNLLIHDYKLIKIEDMYYFKDLTYIRNKSKVVITFD